MAVAMPPLVQLVMNSRLTKTWVVCLLATLCCLLWGSAFPSIKIGYSQFQIPASGTASQILFAGCRFALAGLFTILIGSLMRRKFLFPSKAAWSKVCKVSLVQTVVQYLFFYIGLAHTSGVKSSIIGSASTFFAILIACLIFRQEKLTSRKILGCCIGFSGVVLVNLAGGSLDFGFALNGEGFLLISSLAYALSSVLIKRYGANEDPVMISGYQFLVGGIFLCVCGLVFGGRLPVVTASGLVTLCYLAMLSAVAYSVWSILLKYNPVSKVTVYSFMTPIFGVLLSMLLLHEDTQAFGLQGGIALLLVCLGIVIVNSSTMTQGSK